MGTPVFVITGGDPLARPDVFDLLGAVRGAGMHAGFSPSVTPRLTPAALQRAVTAGADTIHLSLDGACAETHDAFRGVPGSFARTMTALRVAHDTGARLQVGTTVSRRTVAELPAIAESLAGTAWQWALFFLVPTGRAATADMLDPDEHEEVMGWLATTEFPFPVRTVAGPAYRRVLAQHGLPAAPGVNDGNGFCFVSHLGAVCPSGFLQMPVGNVRQRSLADCYQDPLFRALRDPDRLKGKCGTCRYRRICGGSRARAWAVTGDPLASDPTCAFPGVGGDL